MSAVHALQLELLPHPRNGAVVEQVGILDTCPQSGFPSKLPGLVSMSDAALTRLVETHTPARVWSCLHIELVQRALVLMKSLRAHSRDREGQFYPPPNTRKVAGPSLPPSNKIMKQRAPHPVLLFIDVCVHMKGVLKD